MSPHPAAPMPRSSDPLLMVFDKPDKMVSMPLKPAVPELAVRIVIMRLKANMPSSVAMLSAPPESNMLHSTKSTSVTSLGCAQ